MNSSNPDFSWTCPVCHLLLNRTKTSWSCGNNHSFDIAKSGYANLLLAHQKASKQPGDSLTMLKARREFLETKHFMPIVDAISSLITEYSLSSGSEEKKLLDIGCGEGYYLKELKKQLSAEWTLGGLDIAKDGVQMAAKQNKNISWVCASNTRLPISDDSIDVLLKVFSPSDSAQCLRVLKQKGLFVTVSPAANHLYEIKAALYKTVTPHEKPLPPEGFEVLQEIELHFTISLEGKNEIQSLMRMTPFYWCGSADGREKLLSQHTLDVEIAVWVSCFRKCAH